MSIISGVGGAAAFSSASGGKVYAYNALDTTPVVVAPANVSRRKITFHNPGDVDIFIAPSIVLNSSGASVALTPTTSALGGCLRCFANGGTIVIDGECQGAWQAFAASSSGKPLTVIDTNV